MNGVVDTQIAELESGGRIRPQSGRDDARTGVAGIHQNPVDEQPQGRSAGAAAPRDHPAPVEFVFPGDQDLQGSGVGHTNEAAPAVVKLVADDEQRAVTGSEVRCAGTGAAGALVEHGPLHARGRGAADDEIAGAIETNGASNRTGGQPGELHHGTTHGQTGEGGIRSRDSRHREVRRDRRGRDGLQNELPHGVRHQNQIRDGGGEQRADNTIRVAGEQDTDRRATTDAEGGEVDVRLGGRSDFVSGRSAVGDNEARGGSQTPLAEVGIANNEIRACVDDAWIDTRPAENNVGWLANGTTAAAAITVAHTVGF